MSSSCSASSSPIVPFPAFTGSSRTGWTKYPVDALEIGERILAIRVDRGPPRLPRHAHDASTHSLDGCELRLRRVVGDDDRRRDTEDTRHPGDALGHVAGAGRDHTRRELRARRAEDCVGRSAQLEGADRLHALELEPDLGRRLVEVEPDERCADDRRRDPRPRGLDLVERDQNSTSLPTPCSRARRTTSSADARSSTASPSDLKSVSSSSLARPGCVPTSTSPSSALM